jgi:type II secretory pathway pseudopilin PulG
VEEERGDASPKRLHHGADNQRERRLVHELKWSRGRFAMSQAETLTLIAELRRSKRRWKILDLGLMAVLVVLLLIAVVITISAWRRATAEQRKAMEAMALAEQMRDEARRAEQNAAGAIGHDYQGATKSVGNLPDISVFQTHPSDRFLADLDDFTSGHPFKGVNSLQPHAGAHINFDNSGHRWPRGGKGPANYPAIYAVADGVISRVDYRFGQRGGNDRYGLDLTFSVDARGKECRLCYSIEPMIPEPSDGFYRQFLVVQKSQQVRKGDVLGYMYCPPGVKDVHIHFHLMMDGKQGFLAPSIFRPDVVKQFHAKWGGFGRDGEMAMPPCLGYLISAEENPFGTGAKERL